MGRNPAYVAVASLSHLVILFCQLPDRTHDGAGEQPGEWQQQQQEACGDGHRREDLAHQGRGNNALWNQNAEAQITRRDGEGVPGRASIVYWLERTGPLRI